MKLATYRDGSRDGQLVVVSRDLATAHFAAAACSRLQQALDDWNFLSPQLQDLYDALNAGRARHAFAFDPQQCMAPLPRACRWAEGDAYADNPETMLAHGAGDGWWGPTEPARFSRFDQAIDFEGQLAVVTGDVAAGCSAAEALEGVRLLLLVNAWRLRATAAAAVQPPPGFAPVAVTPDELGAAWQAGRVELPLQASVNGRKLGWCEAGPGMRRHFGELIAGLAAVGSVGAGSVVGAGRVRHRDAAQGCTSLLDQRAREAEAHGSPRTAFLAAGDQVRLEMKDRAGASLFGTIAQTVRPWGELPAETAHEPVGDEPVATALVSE